MEQQNQNFLDYSLNTVNGKNVLVTGGTTGIGRATAICLARLGANVLITGLDEGHLNDTMADIETAGLNNVSGIIADLSTREGIDQIFHSVDDSFGQLDILINNAALAYQGISDGEYEDWERIVKTNVLGYLACTHEAVARMKKVKNGHIVNIGSMSADVREKDSSVYVATKSAIQGFSESFRKEVNELGIKVTLIEPGAVGTDMQPVSVPDQQKNIENQEMLKAEDIAGAVVFALIQPQRCDIVEMKVRPHLQII